MANTIRQQRMAASYKQEISALLCFELDHPDLQGVTITQVHVTPDLKLAKIYFQVPEGRERESEVIQGFQHSKKFLKKILGQRVPLKFIPDLRFYYDETEEVYSQIDHLFQKIQDSNPEQGK